jgi:hypothetical protein
MGVVTPGPNGEPPELDPLVLKPAGTNEAAIRDLLATVRWLRAHPELPPVTLVTVNFDCRSYGRAPYPQARTDMEAVAAAMADPVEGYSPPERHDEKFGTATVRDEIGEVVKLRADAFAEDLGAEFIGPFYESVVRRDDGGNA